MTEKWLPIPGWEGLYEVSDHGRVRSLPRVRNTRWGPRLMGKTRLLKQSSTRTPGYFTVPLSRNAATKVHLVHRLVNWGRRCRACARDKARRERREAAQRRANCGAPTAAGTPCKRPSPCYLHTDPTRTTAAARQQAA